MRTLWQDIRYGFRLLAVNPGFTAVAVLTLGLGIGANTAIFSVVNAVLLRPLPYKEADRLVMAWESNAAKGWPQFTVSPPNYLDWGKQSRVFDSLAAFHQSSFVITGGGEPENLDGILATADYLEMAGVRPVLGRPFRPEEFQPGKERVTLLSHALWQKRFAGNSEVLGQALTLNGEKYTVVGVLPDTFPLPSGSQVLAPLVFSPDALAHRGSHYLAVMARLKQGVSLERARSEMSALAVSLQKQYPDTNTGWGTNLVPLYEQVVGDIRPALLTLLGAVGFVLLIACANVANLLLARGAARQKEVALRAALGAGRFRIVRQLLTESVLLALLGGGVGLLLGFWGIDLLRTLQPANIPRMRELGIDARVLLATLAISLFTGLLFGLAPALLASRSSLHDALKEGNRGSGGGGRHRLRGFLVVGQVALSLVLLVGAGLQVRSFTRLLDVDPGFDSRQVLTLGVALPEMKYPTGEKQAAFCEQVIHGLEALPGVERAAVATVVPLSGNDLIFSFDPQDRHLPPGEQPSANWYAVSPGYFRAMRISLVRGRDFTEHDSAAAPRVAIINETMARRIWPGKDPVGQRLTMGIDGKAIREVVGVVRDVKHYGLDADTTMQMYEPFQQRSWDSAVFLVRTASPPADLAPAARRVIHAVDPDQAISDVRTLDAIVSASTSQRRFNLSLISLFAGIALALAAVGIYGVIAYSVAQRTHEIGVRIALGARRRDILRLVLRQGLGMVGPGLLLGLAGAVALTRLVSRLLFGIGPFDAATFTATSVLLAGVALLACYLPARRATRVDPMIALRYE